MRRIDAQTVLETLREPALDAADHGTEHDLEHGVLAEGIGDDLEPLAFLVEQTFKEIGGPDRAAEGDRKLRDRLNS